jgi:hypothetical protein
MSASWLDADADDATDAADAASTSALVVRRTFGARPSHGTALTAGFPPLRPWPKASPSDAAWQPSSSKRQRGSFERMGGPPAAPAASASTAERAHPRGSRSTTVSPNAEVKPEAATAAKRAKQSEKRSSKRAARSDAKSTAKSSTKSSGARTALASLADENEVEVEQPARERHNPRSQRQRFRPLEFWRGERVVYGQAGSSAARDAAAPFESIVDIIVHCDEL